MTPLVDGAVPAPTPVRLWVKLILGACCLAVAAMWVFYFFFATDKGVYQIEDASWRPQALQVCAAVDTRRSALEDTTGGYIAHPTHEQMLQRADIVDTATDMLDQMITDLVAIPVNNDNDRARLQVFEDNYRIIIKDRRRYTAALREFKLAPYTETVVGGGPVSNVVLDVTAGVKGNDLPLCSPPGELGGDVQP